MTKPICGLCGGTGQIVDLENKRDLVCPDCGGKRSIRQAEWCEKAGKGVQIIARTYHLESKYAAIIAVEHEKGCDLRPLLDGQIVAKGRLVEAVGELVEAARETRSRAVDAETTIAENSGFAFHCLKMVIIQTEHLESAIAKVEELR